MAIKSYREMIVWQKAMDLAEIIYCLTQNLPKEETYSLSNQMRRAAVSIPSNIAEGQARFSTKDFVNFLSIAKGSAAELDTQIEICCRLKYLKHDEVKSAVELCGEIGRMLSGLIEKLRARING